MVKRLTHCIPCFLGRGSGFVVSAFASGLSGSDSSPRQGHCDFGFLGKTLYSHSASLQPGFSMGSSKFHDGGNQHPIQRGVEILLVPTSYLNQR